MTIIIKRHNDLVQRQRYPSKGDIFTKEKMQMTGNSNIIVNITSLHVCEEYFDICNASSCQWLS